jgi:hypothetical protein
VKKIVTITVNVIMVHANAIEGSMEKFVILLLVIMVVLEMDYVIKVNAFVITDGWVMIVLKKICSKVKSINLVWHNVMMDGLELLVTSKYA